MDLYRGPLRQHVHDSAVCVGAFFGEQCLVRPTPYPLSVRASRRKNGNDRSTDGAMRSISSKQNEDSQPEVTPDTDDCESNDRHDESGECFDDDDSDSTSQNLLTFLKARQRKYRRARDSAERLRIFHHHQSANKTPSKFVPLRCCTLSRQEFERTAGLFR